MKLILESTNKIVELKGGILNHEGFVPARVWEGKTESGIPVICMISRVAVSNDAGQEVLEQFGRELEECRVPSAEAQSFPLRMIL